MCSGHPLGQLIQWCLICLWDLKSNPGCQWAHTDCQPLWTSSCCCWDPEDPRGQGRWWRRCQQTWKKRRETHRHQVTRGGLQYCHHHHHHDLDEKVDRCRVAKAVVSQQGRCPWYECWGCLGQRWFAIFIIIVFVVIIVIVTIIINIIVINNHFQYKWQVTAEREWQWQSSMMALNGTTRTWAGSTSLSSLSPVSLSP